MMTALFINCVLLLFVVNIKLSNAEIVSRCQIADSFLSRYWTNDNKFKPNGCIDRSNVSLVQIDHGGIFSTFFYLPRGGATRACSNYGGMDCDITTTEQYDLIAMSDLIESIIYRDDVYGLSVTLPTSELKDELQTVNEEDIAIYTWNSGIDEYEQFYSKLHVGQDEYIAGYRGCLHLKQVYGARKILILDVEHGTNIGLVLRARGCTNAMNNNSKIAYIAQTNLQVSAQIIATELINDAELDGILALAQTAEGSAHYTLTTAMTASELNGSFGLSSARAANITAVGTFDYTQDILNHVLDESSFTKFIIDQQPYLQGFLPMYFMGIEATTSNHVISPAKILSGPAFVETAKHVALLECISEDVFYCHDSEEHLSSMVEGCECVDTLSKTIYLFHHGGAEDVGSSLADFYAILVSGATQAANDINVTLEINTYETNGNQLDLDGYLQFMDDIITEHIANIDGIVTTIPNQQIGDMLLNEILLGKEIIGIAEGYAIYKDLDFDTTLVNPMFIGMDDNNAGYEIAELIHNKANIINSYSNESALGLLCLDHEFGSLESLNERCNGVELYCKENGLVYRKINTDASNIDGSLRAINAAFEELSTNNVIIEGIIGTGESSCLSAEYFINEQQYKSYDSIVLGCFDTSQIALDGLLSNSVDFVFDQQPWLIGYTSMIMMTNKILIDAIPSQLLIETGPQVISFDDKRIIYTKECENYYKGYEFCPVNAMTVEQLEINFPTSTNFAGVIMIIFFIFSVLLSLFVLVIMYLWRNEVMFKKIQAEFMIYTIIGGMIMMMSGLFSINNNEITQIMCNFPWSVWSIGFTLFFCSYSLRVWKFVSVVENGLLLKKTKITKKGILIRLCAFVLIDILLNILANTVTPFDTVSFVNINKEFTAADNTFYIQTVHTYCSYFSSNNSIWVLVIIYKFGILLWVITIGLRKHISSDKLRKLRFIKFHEGSNVTVGIYMVMISYLIFALIAFALVTSSTRFTLDLQWVICSFLSFLCYATVIFCVTLHRIIYVYKKKRDVIKMRCTDMIVINEKGEKCHSASSASSATYVDEITNIDPYFQRAEYLVTETIEIVENENFTTSAAVVLSPLVQQLSQQICHKQHQSLGKSSFKSKLSKLRTPVNKKAPNNANVQEQTALTPPVASDNDSGNFDNDPELNPDNDKVVEMASLSPSTTCEIIGNIDDTKQDT